MVVSAFVPRRWHFSVRVTGRTLQGQTHSLTKHMNNKKSHEHCLDTRGWRGSMEFSREGESHQKMDLPKRSCFFFFFSNLACHRPHRVNTGSSQPHEPHLTPALVWLSSAGMHVHDHHSPLFSYLRRGGPSARGEHLEQDPRPFLTPRDRRAFLGTQPSRSRLGRSSVWSFLTCLGPAAPEPDRGLR